jgi:hypothetical protein
MQMSVVSEAAIELQTKQRMREASNGEGLRFKKKIVITSEQSVYQYRYFSEPFAFLAQTRTTNLHEGQFQTLH